MSMTAVVRDFTKKLGVYRTARRVSDQVKWSKTFEYLYEAIHPKAKRAKEGELELFKSLVPAGSLCFDIGANIGDKASIFLAHACRVVAAEPVPRNLEILRKRFGRQRNVTLLEAAVSDESGRATLHVTDDNTSFSTFSSAWVQSLEDPTRNRWGLTVKTVSSVDVETTTLDLLIARFGEPYYIKIDVEGHEVNVVRGLTRKIALISFEANLPEFLSETQACVARLSELGGTALFNYTSARPERLEAPAWLGAEEFQRFIAQTDMRFMEIYCRMA